MSGQSPRRFGAAMHSRPHPGGKDASQGIDKRESITEDGVRSPPRAGKLEEETEVAITPEVIRRSHSLREHHQEALNRLSCSESVSSCLSERIAELRERRRKLELVLEDNLRSLELNAATTAAFPLSHGGGTRRLQGPAPQSSLDQITLHQLMSSLLADDLRASSNRQEIDADEGRLPVEIDAPVQSEGSKSGLEGMKEGMEGSVGDGERSWHWVHRCIESLQSAMTGLQRVDHASAELQPEAAASFVDLRSGSVSGSLDCSHNGQGSMAGSWSLRSSYELSTVLGGLSRWGAHEEILDDNASTSLLDDELQTISDISEDDTPSELEYPEAPRCVLGSAPLMVCHAPPTLAHQDLPYHEDEGRESNLMEECVHERPRETFAAPSVQVQLKDLSFLRGIRPVRYAVDDSDSPRPSAQLEPGLQRASVETSMSEVSSRSGAEATTAAAEAPDSPAATARGPVESKLEELFSMVLGLKADVAKVVQSLAPQQPLAGDQSAYVVEVIGEYIQGQTEVVEALTADIAPADSVDSAGLDTLRSLSTVMQQTTSQLLSLVPPTVLLEARQSGSSRADDVPATPPEPPEDALSNSLSVPDAVAHATNVQDSVQLLEQAHIDIGQFSTPAVLPASNAAHLSTESKIASTLDAMDALAPCAVISGGTVAGPHGLDSYSDESQHLRDTCSASLDRMGVQTRPLAPLHDRRGPSKLQLSTLTSVDPLAFRSNEDCGPQKREEQRGVECAPLQATSPTVELVSVGTSTDMPTEEASCEQPDRDRKDQQVPCQDQHQRESGREASKIEQQQQESSRYATFVDALKARRVAMTHQLLGSPKQRAAAAGEELLRSHGMQSEGDSLEALLAERDQLLAQLHLLGAAVACAPRSTKDPRSSSDPAPTSTQPVPPSTAPRKFRSATERAALAARLAPKQAPAHERAPSSLPQDDARLQLGILGQTAAPSGASGCEDEQAKTKKLERVDGSGVSEQREDGNQAGVTSDGSLAVNMDMDGHDALEKPESGLSTTIPVSGIEPTAAVPFSESVLAATTEVLAGNMSPAALENVAAEAQSCQSVQVCALLNPEPERLLVPAVQPELEQPHPANCGSVAVPSRRAERSHVGVPRIGIDHSTQHKGAEGVVADDRATGEEEEPRCAESQPLFVVGSGTAPALPISALLNGADDPLQDQQESASLQNQSPLALESAPRSGCVQAAVRDDERERAAAAQRTEGSAQTCGMWSEGMEELHGLTAQLLPAGRSLETSVLVLEEELSRLAVAREVMEQHRELDGTAQGAALQALQHEVAECLGEQRAVRSELGNMQKEARSSSSAAATKSQELRSSMGALQDAVQGLSQQVRASALASSEGFAQLSAQLVPALHQPASAEPGAASEMAAAESQSAAASSGLSDVVQQLRETASDLQQLLRRDPVVAAGLRASHQSQQPAPGNHESEVDAAGLPPADGPCMELNLSSGALRHNAENEDSEDGGSKLALDRRCEKAEEAWSVEPQQSKHVLELDLSSFPIGPGCTDMLALRCREFGADQSK